MQRRGLGLLGFGVSLALAMASAMGGCRNDNNSSSDDDSGTPGGTGGATTTTGMGGNGSGGTMNVGGSGGTGGALPVVTIPDITSGTVPEGVDVEVHGVVAMSRKWLVSKSTNTGSCLWGVFLSAPGLTETGPNTGILAVSYGKDGITDNNGDVRCPKLEEESPEDSFPDDVKPGDVLDVVGETSYFLLNACSTEPPQDNPSQVKQRQLAKVEKVTRTGTAPVPTPHTLTAEEYAKLNSPTDQEFHDQWGGVKVRIAGPIAPVLQQNQMGDDVVVGAYGNIFLANGSEDILRVGDKVYYVNGTADPCHTGPQFALMGGGGSGGGGGGGGGGGAGGTSVVWTRIDGFSTVDYCTWSLQPANKCLDFDPPSDDCVAGLMCPP